MNAIYMNFLTKLSHRIFSFSLISVLILAPRLQNNNKQNPYGKVHGLTITYIGNMGILISNPKASILIDGLHEYYGPEYLNPSNTELNKILQQQPPYTGLATILFTHFHRDHYSAKLAKSFLQSAAKNRVAGSPQVIDSLPARAQTINAWNKNGILLTDTVSDLIVYGFNVPHTWQQRHSKVQNVAYLIQVNNSTILHIGDADTDTAAFRRLNIGRIDVMIVPVWFLTDKEGIRIIKEIIKPAKVIATHISPNEKQSLHKYRLVGIETYFFTVINQIVRLPG